MDELNIKEFDLRIKLKETQGENYEIYSTGIDFERKVAEYFMVEKGYNIFHHGRALGKNDNGIDIIAYGQNDILFIQCKYRSSPNTLTEDVYEKAIKGYYTLLNHIVIAKNVNYKLILAVNTLYHLDESLTPVSDPLYRRWIHIDDGIDKELWKFTEEKDGKIKLVDIQ